MDTFWDLYRKRGRATGPLDGVKPTVRQYEQALVVALRHAGYTASEANKVMRESRTRIRDLGVGAFDKIDNIPDPTVSATHTISGVEVLYGP